MIINGVDIRSITQTLQLKPATGKLSQTAQTPKPQDSALTASPKGLQPSEAESYLIEKAVDKVNEVLKKQGHEIQFQIDKATGFSVVQVRDPKTNEIIQQIPSEQMLELAKTLGQEPGQLMNTLA